jgi:hypothetical protein
VKQILVQAIALIPVLWLHGVASFIALAVFVLVSLNTSASNTASKTRALEQRLNAIEPVLFPNTGGTVSGPVIALSTLKVSTTTGSATAEIGGNAHITGPAQIDGEVTTPSINVNSGATSHIGGPLALTGDFTAHGNIITTYGTWPVANSMGTITTSSSLAVACQGIINIQNVLLNAGIVI